MPIQLAVGHGATTRTIAELAERLGSSIGTDHVLVDVSELEDADLTFIQLVDVYRSAFAKDGTTLALSTHENPHIKSLLSRCGYLEGADRSDVEFWIGEETE